MDWAKERFIVSNEAIGVRRYVLVGVVLLIIRFVRWAGEKLQERDMGAFLAIPEWTIWVMVILAFLAYFLLEYAVTLHRKLAPKLAPHFLPDGGCIVLTPNKEYEQGKLIEERKVVYVRGQVEAITEKAVSACVAYLVKVKKKEPTSGKLLDTNFTDPLQLTWSIVGAQEVSIHKHAKRFFDILIVDLKAGQPYVIGQFPLTLRDLFKDKTTYQLDLVIVGEGISVPMKIEFEWDGTLNVKGRRL